MKPTIFYKDEPATQAELTAASRAYIPTKYKSKLKDEKEEDINRFIHHVWGTLVHDGWECGKAEVVQAISEVSGVMLEFSR